MLMATLILVMQWNLSRRCYCALHPANWHAGNFSAGTDEHGGKIAEKANELGNYAAAIYRPNEPKIRMIF
jgi:hypothetical protein